AVSDPEDRTGSALQVQGAQVQPDHGPLQDAALRCAAQGPCRLPADAEMSSPSPSSESVSVTPGSGRGRLLFPGARDPWGGPPPPPSPLPSRGGPEAAGNGEGRSRSAARSS